MQSLCGNRGGGVVKFASLHGNRGGGVVEFAERVTVTLA